MAGTPTTNYNIPTYADTDAPDLSGAYNDAMGIIDTQLKANADAIESATTRNYTGTNPITVDNGQRTISVGTATPGGDGAASGLGVVRVSGKSSDIETEAEINGSTVPNAKAVADYVQSKMVAAGAAYTGTAPIVVDNGSHAISVSDTHGWGYSSGEYTPGAPGTVVGVNTDAFNNYMSTGTDPEDGWGGFAVPSVGAVRGAIITRTPDASTSAKGLVLLTDLLDRGNTNKALTAESLSFASGKYDAFSRSLTVTDLSQLKVNTSTGLVYLNIPASE